MPNRYTVVGYYEDNGQAFVDHVFADNAYCARVDSFTIRVQEGGAPVVVAVFNGFHDSQEV